MAVRGGEMREVRPNLFYQPIFERGIRTREDYVYIDPRTKESFRLQDRFSIPSDVVVQAEITRQRQEGKVGGEWVNKEREAQIREAVRVGAGVAMREKNLIAEARRLGVRPNIRTVGQAQKREASRISEVAVSRTGKRFTPQELRVYQTLLAQGKKPRLTNTGVNWSENGKNLNYASGRARGEDVYQRLPGSDVIRRAPGLSQRLKKAVQATKEEVAARKKWKKEAGVEVATSYAAVAKILQKADQGKKIPRKGASNYISRMKAKQIKATILMTPKERAITFIFGEQRNRARKSTEEYKEFQKALQKTRRDPLVQGALQRKRIGNGLPLLVYVAQKSVPGLGYLIKNPGIPEKFLKGFFSYFRDVGIGMRNLDRAANLSAKDTKVLFDAIQGMGQIWVLLNLYKRKPTKEKKNRLLNSILQYNTRVKPRVGPALERSKQAAALIKKEESKLALFTIGLGAVGGAGAAIGGFTGAVTGGALKTVGVLAAGQQTIQTIKEPTPENFGKLAFFAMPTAIAIFKGVRKLSPNFKPTVKNVLTMRNALSKQLKDNLALIRKLRKGKQAYRGSKKISRAEALKLLRKQNKGISQALKELDWVKRNPQMIKARDFNPRVHTKIFQKLQGSYRTSLHVSTEPKIGNLFGQEVKVSGLKSEAAIKKIALPKAIEQSRPAELRSLKKIDKMIVKALIQHKVILGGGRAQNLQVNLLRRRLSSDYDGKVGKGAYTILLNLAKKLNKEYGPGRFSVRSLKHKGTFSMRDNLKKKDIVDITNVGKEKIPFVTTKKGLRVQSVKSLIAGKANALSKLERFQRKGAKDLADLARLTGGKVTAKDILPRSKNPSDVFQVVRQTKGMGKSRIQFDETHMYFDYEANLAYSYGKKYSIIKFPYSKISKFPKSLRKMVNKAASGQLSLKQSVRLRRSLNRYIKANKNKFFIGPRTASMPVGEREFVLAESSRAIKGNLYKTFDNDLRSFVSVIELGFRRPKKLSLAKKFIKGYKNKPFKTLKYRLTNPDLLTVKKYATLLKKKVRLTPGQKSRFLVIFRKFFASKKAKVGTQKIKKGKRRVSELQKEMRSRRIKKFEQKFFARLRAAPRTPTRRVSAPLRRAITRYMKLPARLRSRTIEREIARVTSPRERTPGAGRQTQRQREPERSRVPARAPTRVTSPSRVPGRTPGRTRAPVRIIQPPPPPTQRIILPTWSSKIKRGFSPMVNVLVRIQGKNREIKLRTTPNRALRWIKAKIDNTTARSFQLKIVGIKRAKDIPKVSLLKFRRRMGRDKRVLFFVEKSKYAIDTKGEKKGLSLARLLKKRRLIKKRPIRKRRR